MTRWFRAAIIAVLASGGIVPAAPGAAGPPPGPDATEIRFTVHEKALLDMLRAATPQTVTVGSSLVSTELTLLDPRDLVLGNGRAVFKIRVKGRTIPVDQVVSPVITIERDARTGQHFGKVSSLPLAMPGLGTVDLRDFLPRFEIPAVIDNPWNVADRPLGIRLRIRRITILEHQLEVGADVDLAPIVTTRAAGSQ